MSLGPAGPTFPGLLPETSRAALEDAWVEREEEATYLKAGGFRSMAAALRCYALEIRLKSIICRHLNLDYLPKVCKTHDYLELIVFTGLLHELDLDENDLIRQQWDFLVQFNKQRLNDLRYRKRVDLSDVDADRIDFAIDDPRIGISAWLSRPR